MTNVYDDRHVAQRYDAARALPAATRDLWMHTLQQLVPPMEQDYRAVKRVTRPMLGFKSFHAPRHTIVCIELTHTIKKGQRVTEEGQYGHTPAEQFYALAA